MSARRAASLLVWIIRGRTCRRSNPCGSSTGLKQPSTTDPATAARYNRSFPSSDSRPCLSPFSTPSCATGLPPHWAPRPRRSTAAGKPCERTAHADRRADRLGQDPRGVSRRDRRSARGGPAGGRCPTRCACVYVSPLKALSADIHKNLAEPRRGIGALAEAAGLDAAARSPPRCAPATRRRRSAPRCCGRRRTSWSRRPSRSTCC